MKITIDIPISRFDSSGYYRETFEGWVRDGATVRVQTAEATLYNTPFYGTVVKVGDDMQSLPDLTYELARRVDRGEITEEGAVQQLLLRMDTTPHAALELIRKPSLWYRDGKFLEE